MKLLWHGAWMEAPGYEIPEGGILIEVAAAVPLVRVENASGRLQRRPHRKVATFLFTDGPWSTLRKARTKRDEPRYTGDFRTSVVLGGLIPSGQRVTALASRVPASSQQLVIHRNLVAHVEDAFSSDDLQCLASRLLNEADVLTRLCRQSFLYSGMEPPTELVGLFEKSLQPSRARGSAPLGRIAEVIKPPQGDRQAAITVLRLESAPNSRGIRVAVLGAGDYTRAEIIPALRKARLSLYSVANREPQIAAMVGREYGFALASTDSERAIAEMPARAWS